MALGLLALPAPQQPGTFTQLSGIFPLTMESTRVTLPMVPGLLKIPSPLYPAVFPFTVELSSLAVPKLLKIPPPSANVPTAVFSLTVELSSVRVPRAHDAAVDDRASLSLHPPAATRRTRSRSSRSPTIASLAYSKGPSEPASGSRQGLNLPSGST
jgi:hypothetical protein